ncbi:hypothetical protein FIBSPDRAFT_924300 [Athelia psychrophila]|uniref:Uncharacterized protein n=1 Tax=Athelia psychrophila TaxID=1759441 RepID=A0A166WM13_9AGAM|nr:hypothetical protein FIBSPDRAFT_924300 [Fibularhizoctonia sp. CBS 109695]
MLACYTTSGNRSLASLKSDSRCCCQSDVEVCIASCNAGGLAAGLIGTAIGSRQGGTTSDQKDDRTTNNLAPAHEATASPHCFTNTISLNFKLEHDKMKFKIELGRDLQCSATYELQALQQMAYHITYELTGKSCEDSLDDGHRECGLSDAHVVLSALIGSGRRQGMSSSNKIQLAQ